MNQLEIDFDAVDKEMVSITKADGARSLGELTLDRHKETLNKKPPSSFLKKNSFYGNLYIPIEIIERMLSAIFLSYSFKINIPPTVEEGNIIFYVDVIVQNPCTSEFETYTGVSAVPIKPVNGTLRDIHPHIPAAKSFAIMNACKHIGRLFRAENDDITNIFNTYFEDKKKAPTLSVEEQARKNMKNRLKKMISHSKTKESLLEKKKTIMDFSDKEVIDLYEVKMLKLKNDKK